MTLMADDVPPALAEARRRDDAFGALVARARAGDAAAFDQLMIATQHKVVSTAWRMLGDREDARDAAQEVYLRVYKYLARYDERQDFHGWLYRITVNVCRDAARLRAGGGRPLTSLEAERGAVEQLPGPGDAERDALAAQQLALVARALQTLPEKERAALVLRDLEGLSTEEVARILKSRPVTVRTQVSSARTKIKRFCDRLLQKGGRAR